MQHISINGVSTEHLSVKDRGLHYGDGLFETIACVDGHLQFWNEHIERMQHGAKQLCMDSSTIQYFKDDVLDMLSQHNISNGVIKLILTRGQSERGYRYPSPQRNTRIVITSDLPEYPLDYSIQGIKACFCQQPVSQNSKLAGIKHLNRLDNVLARNEWQDEYQEGLMLDDLEHVIEGTMSNIFAIKDKQLFTPSLKLSGVNGIIRQQILSIAEAMNIETTITEIKKDQLIEMDEIFVSNSLIGIWPVSSLENRSCQVGPLSQQISTDLQQRMCAA